jgi:hypothetical protein
MEKGQGSCVFYHSYYEAGDNRFPRAVIGWSLKQRTIDGNIDPIETDMLVIDISRKKAEYIFSFLGFNGR